MKISIVTTMYRSAPYLKEFYERARANVTAITEDYEFVFVNDGSPDDSLEVAVDIHHSDPRVKVVDFSRNFGHHKAMMTGLAQSSGDLVFLIDCDLEEEPELLVAFQERMRETNADVVYGVQESRKGGVWERITGRIFYTIFNALSSDPLPLNVLTVRLMTRRYVDSLLQFREREILIAGLWAITGFDQIAVPIKKGFKGSTTYTFRKKAAHLVNSITSFSNRPLVYIFYLGFFIMCISAVMAGYLVIRRFFFSIGVAGWASVMVSVWFLGGLTIFCLGVIGIYLSKIFVETKQRPYTLIRHIYDSESGDR
ncbi:MAG: glycosyltransferase family 2 protein [Candidatus Omnitrophica bacterium]|nr:glycosyltransferase family 2 protein [Candidatus Omnitrophota bacterium]MCA9431887.1 glycosyltransferase family 2 protein [Candidatus Omnitrophota bacterium]